MNLRIAVVSYRNSTSNHNNLGLAVAYEPLYLIEILHQTTTFGIETGFRNRCILSKFYIKPQQCATSLTPTACCILSKFYIKPQLPAMAWTLLKSCILSKFYIKPQLYVGEIYNYPSCILSKFYIKPQLAVRDRVRRCVVSYRNSTSNHNVGPHID